MVTNLIVLETLQNNAHAGMGMSEVEVFNSPHDAYEIQMPGNELMAIYDKFIPIARTYNKVRRQFEKVAPLYDQMMYELDVARDKYDKAVTIVDERREIEYEVLKSSNDFDKKAQLQEFAEEKKQITQIKSEVSKKETQFRRVLG